MRISLTATIAIALCQPALAMDFDQAAVKQECSAKWGTEFDMVKYCMDQRQKGHEDLARTVSLMPQQTREEMAPMIAHCYNKWGQEWDMVDYCVQGNIEAVMEIPGILNVVPENIAEAIARDCDAKWFPEYDMVAYCAEQRVTGWQAINN